MRRGILWTLVLNVLFLLVYAATTLILAVGLTAVPIPGAVMIGMSALFLLLAVVVPLVSILTVRRLLRDKRN